MANKIERDNVDHAEIEVTKLDHETAAVDVAEITTKNPYTEINFIGTYVAILMAVIASYGGYVMPVTSLAFINDDIGPSVNINWVPLVWTLFLALGFTLVGRLSDIFGRRWFFIGTSAIALVGTIVAATAQNVASLIAANVLIGVAAAPQISFNYVLGEIVPVKHRFFANSMLFLIAFPITGMGPYFSRLFIVHTAGGWRWDYYLSIIINTIGTLCWYFFYHPPSFEGLHKNRSRMQELKDLDVGGIILFMGGLILFTMGLSWGGSLYPWNSAHVIATLVVGIVVIIAFIFYEVYMPLNRPLIPMHLYRNREYCVITILAVLGGMIYYSMNVIYPTMIAQLFSTDIVYGGLLSTAIGGGTAAGQFSGSLLATPGGHMKWKLIFVTACLTAFVGGMAGAGYSQATASALITMGSVSLGAIEAFAIGVVTIVIEDQKEIGVAAGVFGSLRSVGGVVATSIYVAILQNKLTENTASEVVPALLNAGLPSSSVEQLLTALSSGSTAAIDAVPGITSRILAVAGTTLKAAYSDSFKIVFLATIPFGVVATIAAFFARDIDSRLTHNVVRRLDVRGKHAGVSPTGDEKQISTHV